MSEPRKNHLSIDGGQVKEDDHVASYKPILDSDSEFRSSKSNVSKSKEKLSPDGAEEKLLLKEDEAKVVRVDMADAKYVVGDHRNGDAKIELDANKRQFSGLTKEELLRYADDPFWVRLRWTMFVLFWAMWFAMLAGAITIIVRAPSCPAPTDKQWYEKWLLVEAEDASYDDHDLMSKLELLRAADVEGIFMEVPTYEVLDDPTLTQGFIKFVEKAKEKSIKVIVDLIPNYVSVKHAWFTQSENKTAPFTDYFIWAPNTNFDTETNDKMPPNAWVSKVNESAWTCNTSRAECYLHQYGSQFADLNFKNQEVVNQFKAVLNTWITAGASGVRLNNARELLVRLDPSKPREDIASGRGAPKSDHATHGFYRHRDSTDLPELDGLLQALAQTVANLASSANVKPVFTLREKGDRPELYLLHRNVSSLSPPSAAPILVDIDVTAAAKKIADRVNSSWPALQLKSDIEDDQELLLFSLLLPAAPVASLRQLAADNGNNTSESVSHVASLRSDASVEHGAHVILAVPAYNETENTLLVCARWKAGHQGYVAVYNPTASDARGDVTRVPLAPASLTVYHVSAAVRRATNYTTNVAVSSNDFIVPARSTLILSYVPQSAAQQ